MIYLYQFILITIPFFKLILCEQQRICEKIRIEPNEIYFPRKQNQILIENDEQDSIGINYNQHTIVSEVFRINNWEKEQIISINIIQSYCLLSDFDKLTCQLLKSKYYFISCIKLLDNKENNTRNIKEQKEIQIDLKIKDDETCEEFFFNQYSEFLIFCFQSYQLKIFIRDFDKKTTQIVQFLIEQKESALCKRKYFKIDDNHYLIVLFQCQNWGVVSFYNKQINMILNEQIAYNNYSLYINYLENIEICQRSLYLIKDNAYCHFDLTYQGQLQFQVQISNYLNLKQIILSQSCSIIYQVQYYISTNKTRIKNNHYEQEFNGTSIYGNLFQNILFVQFNNQLQIIYNQEFQQIIQINSSKINFDHQFNLIYYFDEFTNEIIYYQSSFLKNFIKPTKKYIFVFFSQSLTIMFNFSCYEINYILQQQFEPITFFYFNNICQNNSQLFYSKKDLNLTHEYQIQQPINLNFKINIFDSQPFQQICQGFKKFPEQQQTLLYYGFHKQQSFSLIKTDKYIYQQNCDGQIQFRINTQSYQLTIYYYQSSILLLQIGKKILKFTKFQEIQPTTNVIRLDNEIIKIDQCNQFIIVFTKNNQEFILIDLTLPNIIIMDSKIQRILDNLNEMYLQKQQNNQLRQAFYYSQVPFEFVQYFQYLIVQINSQIRMIKIDSILIVLLKPIVFEQYYILGVHLINNQIIEQIYDLTQISILNTHNLNQYEIIRPIYYQIKDNYFAIAVRNATKTFILLYTISNKLPIKLVKCIQIGKVQFFFQKQYLLYYDQEEEVKRFNIEDFEIQIENPYPVQVDNINIQTIDFSIIPISKNDPKIDLEFSLRCYNSCYELFIKSNHAILNYTQQQKSQLLINNYFYGPIDNLQIIDNDNIIIEGPLLLSEEILEDLNPYGIQIQEINISSTFQIILQTRIILLKFNNYSMILFNQMDTQLILENDILTNIILLNDDTVLLLFIKEFQNGIRGIIHKIDKRTLILQEKPIFQIRQDFNHSQNKFQNFKTGDIIVIKNKTKLFIYLIYQDRLTFINLYFSIVEILKIKGNNQLYISLSFQTTTQMVFFQILLLNDFQFDIIGTAQLTWNTIENEIKEHILINSRKIRFEDTQIIFLESIIDDEKLSITILQIFDDHLVISQIIIILQNFLISYKPIKILRNSLQKDIMELKFYNEYSLILKLFSGATYFYDLRKDQILHDYIGKQNKLYQAYHQFNTTHFICFSNNNKNIYIGKIGYEIIINEEYLQNDTFKLVASNMISQKEVKISLNRLETKNQIQNYRIFIILLLLIVLLILVFYFLIRRMQLKNKSINNQRHDRIQLDNSQL